VKIRFEHNQTVNHETNMPLDHNQKNEHVTQNTFAPWSIRQFTNNLDLLIKIEIARHQLDT